MSPAKLVIVDDRPDGRAWLEERLSGADFQLAFVSDGPQTAAQTAEASPEVVVLDVQQAAADACRRLRAEPRLAGVPLLVIVPEADAATAQAGLEAGADDFIHRPLEAGGLHARLRVLLGQRRQQAERARLEQDYRDLQVAYDATVHGFARILDLQDGESEGHTQRVVELTELLAQAMGLDDDAMTALRYGALLHDIGKMSIPYRILLKPGPLDDEEWAIMRQHPERAYEWLSTIPFLSKALDIPYCHHEKWDGTGYPRGLRGDAIPLEVRLFTVVNVWDALLSDRPYRAAWTEAEARQYMLDQSGRHFDPQVVAVFLKLIDEGA